MRLAGAPVIVISPLVAVMLCTPLRARVELAFVMALIPVIVAVVPL